MLDDKLIKKFLLSISFILFLFSNLFFIITSAETTMTIYNTTGNSTDAKGSLTIKINDTSHLDKELQNIISKKLNKDNIDFTLDNQEVIPNK